MARERYLLDDTEDTIHENEIKPQTAADKRKNWWDYHKVHVLLVVLAIAVVGYFIYSVTSKTKPDYTITVMTQYTVPSDLQTDIQELFEKYADDRNGDGKTYVAMNFCRFNTSGTSEFETSELQASFVKFATDASAGDSMIFAYDDASYKYLDQDDLEGFFGPVDGTDNDYYLWKDIPALNNLELNHYNEEGATKESVLSVLGELKVAVRTEDGAAFKKQEKIDYRNDSVKLYECLLNDAPANTEN